jgi:hypothetical protein
MLLPRILSALVLASSITLVTPSQAQDPEPTVWGALSGNSSCVIFAEGRKTSGRFYGVAVTTKTVGKLTLIEAQNTTFGQKEVLETQDNMNNLMQMAQKDRIKFVKIPEKYSPELLEKARASCAAGAS